MFKEFNAEAAAKPPAKAAPSYGQGLWRQVSLFFFGGGVRGQVSQREGKTHKHVPKKIEPHCNNQQTTMKTTLRTVEGWAVVQETLIQHES